MSWGEHLRASGRMTEAREDIADIIEFVDSQWGLGGSGLRLFPVQRVILKAHYGLELDDKIKQVPVWGDPNKKDGWKEGWRRKDERMLTESDYLKYLFDSGRCNIREIEPGRERREMLLSVGRRSGKTFMSSCIAAYETYKLLSKFHPQRYYGLPDSNSIQLISVATDKDQAGILFNEVSGHFSQCDFFAQFLANNTQSYVKFQSPQDIERYGRYGMDQQDPSSASIKITFRSCVAKGLRGAGNICVILDEFAHFTDGSQSSAAAVYNAVKPSLSAFSAKDPETKRPINPDEGSEGRMIMISSPLGRQGEFYKQYRIAMGDKGPEPMQNMLAIQAPTWEVNPTLPPAEFAVNYAKDVNVFFTEYGGEFTDRTRGWIEDKNSLYACIDPTARPKRMAPPRMPHFIGIDFAQANDATAIAIGHLDPDGKIVVDLVDCIRAGEGEYEDSQGRLDLDKVADWIKDISKKFYLTEGIFDQWAGIAFEQALHKRGLSQIKKVDFKRNLNAEIYKNFKDMMYEQRLSLYDYPIPDDPEIEHCEYIEELCTLQATQHSKHIITVEAPNTANMHDDMSDALVRMVWLASKGMVNGKTFGRPVGRQAKRLGPRRGRAGMQGGKAFASTPKRFQGGSHESRQPEKAGKRAVFGRGKKKW